MSKPPNSTVAGIHITGEQAAALKLALADMSPEVAHALRDIQIRETPDKPGRFILGGIVHGTDEDIRANMLAGLVLMAWRVDKERGL